VDEVRASEVGVFHPIAQHEIGGGEHGGRDGDDGFLRPAAALQPDKLRVQIAT
jgi:hypothetical protein